MKEKIAFGWSGGKDSALALHEVLRGGKYDVAALVTTCTEGYNRISMHGVRCELLERQAAEIDVPLRKVFISKGASNAEYESQTLCILQELKAQGVTAVAFGDLFLEDIRAYRDRMLATIGLKTLYPVWGINTKVLAKQFIRDGFGAKLAVVDPRKLDKSFVGRDFDAALLRDLPATVDPCGENGEFHTFVFAAPFFRNRINVSCGEIVHRESFYFCDLIACGT